MSGPAPSAPGRFGTWEALLLAVASLVWGAAYVFIRQGILLGASPLAFAASRYALSALAFAGLAALRREPMPGRRDLAISASVGGILIIGLYGGFLYWGEQYTTGGYASVLASTVPILTVVVAFFLLGSDRLGPGGLAGIGIGFVGATVLVVPELFGSPLGSWQGPVFVVAAMLSATVGSVLLRRVGRGPQGLWQIGTQFGVASLLLGAGALLLPVPEALPLTGPVLAELAALVVFSSVLGYFAYFSLHHRIGPTRANIVAYLVPVVGVAIGSGLFAEPFTAWEVAGVLIVLAGVTLVLRDSARRAAAAASAAGGAPTPEGPFPAPRR